VFPLPDRKPTEEADISAFEAGKALRRRLQF
jgi:hypothetical protein